ncbi:MAG: hypothetical protein ACRBCS_05865 [Cellvibrionaceae bacterium]
MEKFQVRPGYKSKKLLVEFWGEHRGESFPDIQGILAQGLEAKPVKHPTLDTATIAIATDEFITLWKYKHGEYELDDDTWAFFIHAPNNNIQVISDIERVLLASGQFIKEETDYSQFT